MYKQITILICFNIFNIISCAYLEAESNYLKPKLERNNIVNKGLWMRSKLDKKRSNDFIFRANSLDVDNVLQNNYDAFGNNNIADPSFFSGYIDRSKRSINDKSKRSDTNDRTSIVKSKLISTLKPASVFNDYPYEIAVLLNNKRDQSDLSENIEIHNKNKLPHKFNHALNVTQPHLINTNESIVLKDNAFTYIGYPKGEQNKTLVNRTVPVPKRSMNQGEYESELIKKIEFTEDYNITAANINKSDRNVFDKEDMAWHNSAPPNVNVYKILPKAEENARNKPITERGLIKVLSMLTKTFKKIMKQHHDIKRIHNKLQDLNDDFMKNAELLTIKFEDFNSKYSFILKVNEELKTMENKLKEREQSFSNREKDLSKNLKEFESQQKKFLAQQRQFYNVQKLMLAQNEKINVKQNVIAKTQSEISHRQNNFARILKKAKQIYIDSKNLLPSKLNTAITKSKLKPSTEKAESINNPSTTSSTSTTTPTTVTKAYLPPSTTDTVKINLFTIPTLARLENQDQMILDEKDYQPVDELIYKYYFNNTFIDDLMKTKILATFIAASDNNENNNAKNKRNQVDNLKTTLLVPVNKTIVSNLNKKHRNRRWIKHSKRNYRKKEKGSVTVLKTTPVIENVPDLKENIVLTKNEYIKKDKTVDPYITMALTFCKEIGQNVNLQILNWCVEKALRRLQVVDLKISPLIAPPIASIGTTPSQETPNDITTSKTRLTPNNEMQKKTVSTVSTDTLVYFPDNDELESKLKEYELKPDPEGTVYYDGSLHASDVGHIGRGDSDGFSDIMPGLDSNSRVQVDPLAFDLQAQRRADVRRINEKIMKMRMV